MNGYETIKELKRELRASEVKANVTDLLALTMKNDPFYAGAPATVLVALWFANLWDSFGLGYGVHIRRFHYRLISQETPPVKHDGTPYENTDKCWGYLVDAAKQARYLGLVDPCAFVDRRNPDPINFREVGTDLSVPLVRIEEPFWQTPSIDSDLGAHGINMPEAFVSGYDYSKSEQPYHLELWVEKSTMNDVLIPACRGFGINLVTSLGFQSITSVLSMMERVIQSGKPARIFYISDFDPAGDDMPIAVARQCEFWLQEHCDCEVKLQPLALTESQCVEYQLPRSPIKDEDRRKEKFESRFGEGATELDALEALHPGALVHILREAVAPYWDDSLHSRMLDAGEEASETVQAEWEVITDPERQELEVICAEIEQVTSQYEGQLQALSEQLRKDMEPFEERLETVRHATLKKSDQLDAYLPPRPDPQVEQPDEFDWLFDSGRDYLDQLANYKKRQGKRSLADLCGA